MAHTKAQKAVRGNRDSQGKRLGVKVHGGQSVIPGNIIVRQKGSTYRAGVGTILSNDFTILAKIKGKVEFILRQGYKYICVK